MTTFQSTLLTLASFRLADAKDVFACITPAITKYLPWDPPTWDEFIARCEEQLGVHDPADRLFVVRRRADDECLGVASFERADQASPEIGLWLRETAHGQGYGREVVVALVAWASKIPGVESFTYPVAVENTASRRIAECLGGEIVAKLARAKYDAVIYRIPAKPQSSQHVIEKNKK